MILFDDIQKAYRSIFNVYVYDQPVLVPMKDIQHFYAASPLIILALWRLHGSTEFSLSDQFLTKTPSALFSRLSLDLQASQWIAFHDGIQRNKFADDYDCIPRDRIDFDSLDYFVYLGIKCYYEFIDDYL